MLWEDVQQLREGVTREAFGFNGGDSSRNVEDLSRFCQANHVVLQYLTVDRLHAEGHLRLLIDKDHLAIFWGQYFKLRVGHVSFHCRVS